MRIDSTGKKISIEIAARAAVLEAGLVLQIAIRCRRRLVPVRFGGDPVGRIPSTKNCHGPLPRF